jgi:hypothetical protein
MSTPCPMSKPTSSSAGAGGGVRGRGAGIDLAVTTADGSTIVLLPRPSTEGCRTVGGTTTGSTAGKDVNGSMNASPTAIWNTTGAVGKGTGTGNSRAFGVRSRDPSGPGQVSPWRGGRKGPCRCVPRSRLPGASRNARCDNGKAKDRTGSRDKKAAPSNQVSRDLAAVDRRAARTVGPHPAGATTTGADSVADSDLQLRPGPAWRPAW